MKTTANETTVRNGAFSVTIRLAGERWICQAFVGLKTTSAFAGKSYGTDRAAIKAATAWTAENAARIASQAS